MKYFKKIVAATLLVKFLTVGQYALGQAWVQTGAPTDESWTTIATSADGTQVAAVSATYDFSFGSFSEPKGLIYLSGDSGSTWKSATNVPTAAWISICSSADGSVLAAIMDTGPVYLSKDFGFTWSPIGSPNQHLDCIACSARGDELATGAWNNFTGQESRIYVSWPRHSGWIASRPPSRYWTSIACSANGKILVASCVNAGIYLSRNWGISWSKTTAPPGNWYAIACSSDGMKMAAAISGGDIYVSGDSGKTWLETGAPNLAWNSIAMSADGNKIAVAATFGGAIFTSTNFGMTWNVAAVPALIWNGIASSADGCKLFAASFKGGIYSSQIVPTPQIITKQTRKAIIISWVIPSESFVLQQSVDGLTWLDVTNQPALDLTSLHLQVSLPLTYINSMFRLEPL